MIVTKQIRTTEAMKRIRQILDPGSFMEIGRQITARQTDFYAPEKAVESDGVISGYGSIEGRLVYIFSQDGETMGGSFGEMHGGKIARIYRLALKTKAPIIGLIDCSGLRIEEGLDSLDAFGALYALEAEASGKIPQIMGICGSCSGGMAVAANMADFVLTNKETLADDIRSLICLLPPNTSRGPEQEPCRDDLNRLCPKLIEKRGKGREILQELADDHRFFEVREKEGGGLVTGFLRMNGNVIGGIANHYDEGENGKITGEGFDRAASFLELCGKFHIPLLTVTDVKGFEGVREAGRMVKALSAASVPKVNLIAGEIFGSAYSILNCKGIGADYVFMWDSASVSMIDPLQAAELLYPQAELAFLKKRAEDYRQTHCSPTALARHGYADKIIAPQDSRKYILGAFETFANGGAAER